MNQDEFIYIIRDLVKKNVYKIGISKEPQKRIKNLQTGNSNKIKIIFELKVFKDIKSRQVEKVIHQYLKEKNMWISGEWFKIENEDTVYNLAKTMLVVGQNRTNNI
jgi:hypothetical protein